MDVFEAIKTRRSIRKYLSVPVEWEKVGRVLEAGKAAPSAGNLQDWRFLVITDKGQKQCIAHAAMEQNWMVEAPIHIVILGVLDKAKRLYGVRGERLYMIQDCAAAAQNMLLTAHALGLGSCWVGSFDEDALRRCFFIPDEVIPQSIVTIGYADEVVPEPPEYTLENIIFFRNYGGQGNRIKNIPAYHGEIGTLLQEKIKSGKDAFKKLTDKLKKK